MESVFETGSHAAQAVLKLSVAEDDPELSFLLLPPPQSES